MPETKHTHDNDFCPHPSCLYFKPGMYNSWYDYWQSPEYPPFYFYTEEVEIPQLGVSLDKERFEDRAKKLLNLQELMEERYPDLARMHREVAAYIAMELEMFDERA